MSEKIIEEMREMVELGRPLRERIENVLLCKPWDKVVRDDYTEVLLFASTKERLEDALFYYVIGVTDKKPIMWRVPPEICDRTADQNELRRDCGITLWGGYARFRVLSVT